MNDKFKEPIKLDPYSFVLRKICTIQRLYFSTIIATTLDSGNLACEMVMENYFFLMEATILGISDRTKLKAMVYSNISMEIIIKDSLKITLLMDLDSTIPSTEESIEAIGRKISGMAQEKKHGLMVPSFKATI